MVELMSDVSFNEPTYASARPRPQKQSLLTRLMFSVGLAKTEAGAQRVLLIIAVVAAVAAAGIYLFTNAPAQNGGAGVHAPSPNEI